MANVANRMLEKQGLSNEQQEIDLSFSFRLMTRDGISYENDYCLVKIEPTRNRCIVKEKISYNNTGYWTFLIRDSYKTGDFYGAIGDLFDKNTKYEHLVALCRLHDIQYVEKFVQTPLSAPPPMPKEEIPVPPVLEAEEEPIKIEVKEEEVKIERNDERSVDL